jgi:arylsulfatase A-like enzyme
MQTILVTVDALGADHLRQYGYERDTMPALDRLVDAGMVFENAYSNAPYTRISIPSFQTSHYLAYEAMDRFPTIASLLSEEGIQTTVIGTQTGIGLIEGDFKFNETIDLGRDEFHEEANRDRALTERVKYQINRPATWVSNRLQKIGAEKLYETIRKPYNVLFAGSGFRYLGYQSAEHVTDRALTWLEEHAEEDFFLWIHYMEGHRPYGVHDSDPAYVNDGPVDEGRIKQLMKTAGLQPEAITPQDRELMIDLYDSDLRYCSRQLDRLFDGLEKFGIWEDGNILFSSDHGEEFGEHGRFYHRNYPYEELTHVPLVVKTATGDAVDRESELRELLDLAPTIVGLHGLDPSAQGFEGIPLFDDHSRVVLTLGQPKDAGPCGYPSDNGVDVRA